MCLSATPLAVTKPCRRIVMYERGGSTVDEDDDDDGRPSLNYVIIESEKWPAAVDDCCGRTDADGRMRIIVFICWSRCLDPHSPCLPALTDAVGR